MNKQEVIAKLNSLPFCDVLAVWRFAASGHPIFFDSDVAYCMSQRIRDAREDGTFPSTSKELGWDLSPDVRSRIAWIDEVEVEQP